MTNKFLKINGNNLCKRIVFMSVSLVGITKFLVNTNVILLLIYQKLTYKYDPFINYF